MVRALHQEVVAQGQQDVHVGLAPEAAQQPREPRLHLRRVQREQLLELVYHQERLAVALAPAAHEVEGDGGIVEAQQLADRLRVARQLAGERVGQAERRGRPGGAHERAPALGPRRHDPRAHERRLARPRGADHTRQAPRSQPLPQRRDFRLPPEEDRRVLLREAREPRVRALLFHLLQRGRAQRRLEHGLQRQRQVVRRAEPLPPVLLQAPTHDPAERRRDPPPQRR